MNENENGLIKINTSDLTNKIRGPGDFKLFLQINEYYYAD